MQPMPGESFSDLPPIVLLVDEGGQSLPLYAPRLESAGLWVSCLTRPTEALASAQDLRPDVIVADIHFGEGSPGWGLLTSLNACDVTRDVPLIALTTPAAPVLPEAVRPKNTRCLVKPVGADALLADVQQLLLQDYACHLRADREGKRRQGLVERSRGLVAPADSGARTVRSCPGCAHVLEWVEEGRMAASTYDYYHWCVNGCGLFAYDRQDHRWVTLAPGGRIADSERSDAFTQDERACVITIVTDRAGVIVEMGPAAAKLLNLSARHARGASLLPFLQEGRLDLKADLGAAGLMESPQRAVILRPRERRPRPAFVSLRETDDGIRWRIRSERLPVPPARNRRNA